MAVFSFSCEKASQTPPAPAGPHVTPIATAGGVTFAVPRGDAGWAAASFACYKSAVMLSPGASVTAPLTTQFPKLPAALAASGLSLEQDLMGVGGYQCGPGADSICFYFAMRLRDPASLARLFDGLAPGGKAEQPSPGHFRVTIEGVHGPREIHLDVVPVDWTGVPGPTADPWDREARQATHLVFFSGVDQGKPAPDPLADLADPAAGAARVRAVEAVAGSASGRCIAGEGGKGTEFQPGYTLERVRFALVAPEGAGDQLAAMVGSHRSIDLEVDMVLTPMPPAQLVDQWIEQGRAFVRGIADQARAAAAGAGGAFAGEALAFLQILTESGFSHQLGAGSLRLSWATRRIPAAQLAQFQDALQGMVGGARAP